MTLWKDRNTFTREWGTREALRRVAKDELYRRLAPPPGGTSPRGVVLTGAPGSGTSRLGRRIVAVLSHPPWNQGRRIPRHLFRVDLRESSHEHAALVQFFRHFDESFLGSGYSSSALSELLRRRLRSEEGPVLVWVDNARDLPNFSNFWHGLLSGLEELPEGSALVISGSFDPTAGVPSVGALVQRIELPAPGPEEILDLLREIAREGFVVPPEEEVLKVIALRARSAGIGLEGAIEMLEEAGVRAEERSLARVSISEVGRPRGIDRRRDPRQVAAAILQSLSGRAPSLEIGVLQRSVGEWFGREGIGPPSPSLIRRHVGMMERAGVLTRTISLGGNGGTRSVVRLRSPPA